MHRLLVLGVCIANLGCGLEQARRNADITTTTNNLAIIGLGCAIYENDHGHFPTDIRAADGRPLLSWRVALLPLIEEAEMYKQFRLNEPWDSPHNQTFLKQMPKWYRGNRQQTKDPSVTFFRGFSGAGGVLGANPPLGLSKVSQVNGLANTILIVEAAEATPWTKPDDHLLHDLNQPLPKLQGPDGFFLAYFCDRQARRIPNNTPEEAIRRMIQWDNTKPVELPQ